MILPHSHHQQHLEEGIFEIKKTPGPGLCMVKGCRGEVKPKKMGLCYAHFQARWRFLNRKKSAYAILRDHAKARGLEFNLTYDYFLGMTDCAGYWDMEAEKHGDKPTIDRVDPTKGYVMGNIRVVSHSENVRKGNREKHLPAHVQHMLERKRARMSGSPTEEDRCPF